MSCLCLVLPLSLSCLVCDILSAGNHVTWTNFDLQVSENNKIIYVGNQSSCLLCSHTKPAGWCSVSGPPSPKKDPKVRSPQVEPETFYSEHPGSESQDYFQVSIRSAPAVAPTSRPASPERPSYFLISHQRGTSPCVRWAAP